MRILVTGATGFIGRHLITVLADRGHDVVASARRPPLSPLPPGVRFVVFDIAAQGDPAGTFGTPDLLIHLAWSGLPNYRSLAHIEDNLASSYRFIKAMVLNRTPRVLVAGTCFEYGLKEGCLAEDVPPAPETSYGIAKDALRRFLQELAKVHPYRLQWVRLFYMHGAGQNPRSLMAQLDAAIARGDEVFDMSGGEQLRDYLPVEDVARRMAAVAERAECNGIINCCSGRPVTVRRLVEDRIRGRGSKIRLNLGHYAYPNHEPMAFWGNSAKIDQILNDRSLAVSPIA